MHRVTDATELNKVLDLAREYLNRYQPDSYRLEIDPDSVQQEEDWYYIVVKPDRGNVRSSDYSARLAEAEQDIERDTGRNVLFVPVAPD